MKICNKCKKEKEYESFNKDSSKKDGLHTICKSCSRTNSAKYYKNNKEKIKKDVAKWAQENKEKMRKYASKYYNNNKEKAKESNRKWKNRNKNKINEKRRKKIKRRLEPYDISFEKFHQMLNNQNNKCLICNRNFDYRSRSTRPTIDHNHYTNKIRGLLCFKCNIGISMFNENIDILKHAIGYIEYDKFCQNEVM
ncbi:MAG: endonuclease domain-containing protein [Promethearchaeota archaeon]|jgi:hypothetical protein